MASNAHLVGNIRPLGLLLSPRIHSHYQFSSAHHIHVATVSPRSCSSKQATAPSDKSPRTDRHVQRLANGRSTSRRLQRSNGEPKAIVSSRFKLASTKITCDGDKRFIDSHGDASAGFTPNCWSRALVDGTSRSFFLSCSWGLWAGGESLACEKMQARWHGLGVTLYRVNGPRWLRVSKRLP